MLNRDSFLTYKEFILMMMSFSLLDFFRSVEWFERKRKKKRFELEHDNAARNTSLLNMF